MFERIDGQDVFTVTFGSGSTVVVGVAGSFGSTDIWLSPFETLSASVQTHAYDHYGTGLTAYQHTSSLSNIRFNSSVES